MGQQGDYLHLAGILPAHHLFDCIIPAFYQDIGPQQFKQLLRRIVQLILFYGRQRLFREYHHHRNHLQGTHDGCPVLQRGDRPSGALQAGHGLVAIQPNHQMIAQLPGRPEQMHMAGVQQLKAAVGEYPPPAGGQSRPAELAGSPGTATSPFAGALIPVPGGVQDAPSQAAICATRV